MANRVLKQLYRELFDEEFQYFDFSKRMKMQKGIYLLTEMGVPVGNYRFSWYKHGPYSQTLLDDMYSSNVTDNVELTSDTKNSIIELKKALKVPIDSKYNSEEWAECLGSIYYLKENVFPFTSNDYDLLRDLTIKKPHLNDEVANRRALDIIKELFYNANERKN